MLPPPEAYRPCDEIKLNGDRSETTKDGSWNKDDPAAGGKLRRLKFLGPKLFRNELENFNIFC